MDSHSVESAESFGKVRIWRLLLFSSSLLHSVDQDIHSPIHRSMHRTNSVTHDMDISLDSPDEGQEKTHITIADILGTFWSCVVSPEDSCTFSPQSTPFSPYALLNRSGCVFQDGIIKVITDIRSDMRSSPHQDEHKLFLRQEMVCRGGTDSAPVCCSALLEGVGEAAGLGVRTVSDQQR